MLTDKVESNIYACSVDDKAETENIYACLEDAAGMDDITNGVVSWI